MDGKYPTKTTNNLHWNYDCTNDIHSVNQEQVCPDFSRDFHSYAVEWSPDHFAWYLDNSFIRGEPNNYSINHPQHIVANLALFRDDPPDAFTMFPSNMIINNIKVFKLKMDCSTVVNEILDFNSFNFAVKKSISLSNSTIIPSNSDITLRATDFIKLNNGFSIPLGTKITFAPTPCY